MQTSSLDLQIGGQNEGGEVSCIPRDDFKASSKASTSLISSSESDASMPSKGKGRAAAKLKDISVAWSSF